MLHPNLTLSVPALQKMKLGAVWGKGHQWWTGVHFQAGWGAGDAGPPGEPLQRPDSASPSEMQTLHPDTEERTTTSNTAFLYLHFLIIHVLYFIAILSLTITEKSGDEFRPGHSLHKVSRAPVVLLNLPWPDGWRSFLVTWKHRKI